jgi:hypothetical protein
MADATETIITVKADTKPAEASFDELGEKAIGIVKNIGAGFAAYLSAKAFISGLQSAVTAAMEAERATRGFNSALAMTGQFTQDASDAFNDYATELEKTTGISDDLIVSNAALLVSIGKLSGDGLQRATKAALDLSAGMQIDVGTAFDIVTKATQGNVTALSKYGLEVSKSATDSQKFADALGFIETRFGGLSAAATKTFEGALTKVKNGFGDIEEKIGTVITSDKTVIAFLSTLGDLFYDIAAQISQSNINLGSFINILLTVSKYAVSVLVTPIEFAIRAAINGLFRFPDLFLQVFRQIAGTIDFALGTDIEQKIFDLSYAIEDIRASATEPIKEGEMWTQQFSRTVDELQEKMNKLASTMQVTLPRAAKTGGDGATKPLDDMESKAKQLGATFTNSLVNVISQGVQHIGKRLLEGRDIFGGLLAVILNTFGDMAIQLGTMFIGIGIAVESLKVLTGFAAVAAGIGLVLVGTIMKGFAAGSSAAMAPVSNANASAADAVVAAGDVYQETQEEERQTPQTGVQVIVQGNIFDNRETGLQIAQIINDSFDLEGTLIRATV